MQIAQSALYFGAAFGLALPVQQQSSGRISLRRKSLAGFVFVAFAILSLITQWRSFALDENVSLESSTQYLRHFTSDEKVLSKHLFVLQNCKGEKCAELEDEAASWTQKASNARFLNSTISYAVNPGSVFISLMKSAPSSSRKKSTRAMPSHFSAAKARKACSCIFSKTPSGNSAGACSVAVSPRYLSS